MSQSETVAILGASNDPERYSYKALKLLAEYGHRVVLVHPKLQEIEGNPVLSSLSDIAEGIDTLTLYVRPELSEKMKDEIIALKPARIIMNPGTESDYLEQKLLESEIDVVKECTLVLLKTNRF